jgi:hypothetical protein
VFASLVLMGATHQGLAVPGTLHYLERQDQFLPLTILQDDLLEFVERKQARDLVQTTMKQLKAEFEKANSSGTLAAVNRTLANFGARPGLERGETKDFYHRYNIHEAKELEPLRKAFVANTFTINEMEGRNLEPDTVLKEGDFWKLFFDAGESFAATGQKYQPKPWPPVVKIQSRFVQQFRLIGDPGMIDDPRLRQIAERAIGADASEAVTIGLFEDAERPFLFWRTADEPAVIPDKLADVRDRVVEAWKFNKARETLVLQRGRKIAETVQKQGPSILPAALDDLRKEYGAKRELIELRGVSPLVPVAGGGMGGFGQTIAYQEYQLPADKFTYPRKDMAAELLGLHDLKKPIEIGYPPLDDLNKALFKEVESAYPEAQKEKRKGKYVQILTNQPQTIFYVAYESAPPFISHFDFNRALQGAFHQDLFFQRSQNEAAKELQRELTRHLREVHQASMPDDDIKKNFDSDATQ